jgi:hypothetical protein
MILFIAVLATVAFAAAFLASGLIPAARRAVAISGQARTAMTDPGLDDMAKEKAVQAAALGLMRSTLSLAARSLACLAAPALVILGADALGLASDEAVIGVLLDPVFIAATLVVFLAIPFALRAVRK